MRCAIPPGARQQPLPDAGIDGGGVSCRCLAKMLASNADADGAGDTNQRRFFRLKLCLPTASGCHFYWERRLRNVAVFWAAPRLVKLINWTVRQRTILVASRPANSRPAGSRAKRAPARYP